MSFITRPSPSCSPYYIKVTPEVGPTCQLCDTTGHAARSCPTHLNEVEANRILLGTLDALEASNREQKQRLAALDDQVKGLIKDVNRAIKKTDELLEEEEPEGLNEEFWQEHQRNTERVNGLGFNWF